jgi:hypothetical protein
MLGFIKGKGTVRTIFKDIIEEKFVKFFSFTDSPSKNESNRGFIDKFHEIHKEILKGVVFDNNVISGSFGSVTNNNLSSFTINRSKKMGNFRKIANSSGEKKDKRGTNVLESLSNDGHLAGIIHVNFIEKDVFEILKFLLE